ncbi:MAG TPA: hypothetical protein VET65_07510 [Candidatus Limnocylindrales bacterium]|nr:hypothetical protein [Candidatus Limnocylindrales bacterium]
MSGAILAQLAIVAAGAAGLLVILRRARRRLPGSIPSAFDAALTLAPQPAAAADEFESFRRALEGARHSAYDVHYRLRPLLRDLASSRLRQRRGIELDAEPDLAATVLGEEAFALLRERRPAPRSFRRPAMTQEALERVVRGLESI